MPFCRRTTDSGERNFTVVDNIFLTQYLPGSPARTAEVYLLGLALQNCAPEDNTAECMSRRLSLSIDDILSAYEYWEELGLVYIKRAEPLEIVYLPIASGEEQLLRKLKPQKYAAFCKQIQAEISGRSITPNEFNVYFSFLENVNFQPEALVAVARYAVRQKGANVLHPYIIAVARNLARGGVKTLEAVEQKLTFNAGAHADLALVFKNLSLSRQIDYSDIEMFENWTHNFGFEAAVIIKLAKNCKKGGMAHLDNLLKKYFRARMFSVKEIEQYNAQREESAAVAKEVCRRLGVYYENTEIIIDEYITAWFAKGFDAQTVQSIAAYCFKSGVRTLEGMNKTLLRLNSLGVCSENSLSQYIAEAAEFDANVRGVLDSMFLERRVTAADRQIYRVWTQNWQLPHDLIIFAAQNCSLAANPVGYLNKLLSNMRAAGVTSVAQAEKTQAAVAAGSSAGANAANANFKPAKKAGASKQFAQHEYTDEQLRSLFGNLDEIEV